MSSIGSPADMSMLQAAQAQQVASKSRDKEKAESESARRFQDLIDLRVAGVETADAVRQLPGNDSEQAQDEHDRGHLLTPDDGQPPTGIDVTG